MVYIFITSDIRIVGGMQCYVAGAAKYLESIGCDVKILYSGFNKALKSSIPYFDKFVNGRFPDLSLPPFMYPYIYVEYVIHRIVKFLKIPCEEKIVIESQDDSSSQWGELLAQHIKAKHIITLCNEVYRGDNKYYEDKIDFYIYKFGRKEILGSRNSFKKLFKGYLDIPDNFCDNLMLDEDPIQDIVSPKVDLIKKMDWNVCYIGRANKGYVVEIIKDIANLANKYKNKKIQFILVGDATFQRKTIIKYLSKIENLVITELGDLIPIPRALYQKVDLVIAGSGSARCSVYEGKPVIVADAITYKSEGLLGYQTQESISNENNKKQKTFVESIEDVLIYKIHEKLPFAYTSPIGVGTCVDANLKEIAKSSSIVAYYDKGLICKGNLSIIPTMVCALSNIVDKQYIKHIILKSGLIKYMIKYVFERSFFHVMRKYWYPLRKKKLMSNPQKHADILYYMHFHKHIDWSYPKDLNEIINFLEFKTDTSLWVVCADKYAVREYVEKKISKEVLIPLYGKWDKSEDIDFDILPQKFVIKMNNGSGDTIIVKDKKVIDRDAIRMRFKYAIQNRFGLETAEPHYVKISPCIIAEKLIEPLNGEGLIDYKIWCLNGSPFCIMTCSNRNIVKHTVDFNVYDLEWNCIDKIAITHKYRNNLRIPKPLHLNKMLRYAEILSSDFVESRIDFYEVDGHVYFGEITLSSMAGRMDYFTPEFLLSMGKQIRL